MKSTLNVIVKTKPTLEETPSIFIKMEKQLSIYLACNQN
jgi:hypothetical protein